MLDQPLSDTELAWRSIEIAARIGKKFDKQILDMRYPMSEQPNPNLNAAQLGAVHQEVQRQIAGLRLRQWVVEQVLQHGNADSPTEMSRSLYNFIVGTEETEE